MPVKNRWLLPFVLLGLILLLIIPLLVYAVDTPDPFIYAKNAQGELAMAGDNEIFIFDTAKKWTKLVLPELTVPELVRIITNLNWHNNGNKLLYTALEDFPDLGSTFFSLTALERDGSILGSAWIENLASAAWLKDERILFLAYEHPADEDGKLFTWEYQTGEIVEFLPELKIFYSHLAYYPAADLLALVDETERGDRISCIDLTSGETEELLVHPHSILSLEWSSDGTLNFCDEYNNFFAQTAKKTDRQPGLTIGAYRVHVYSLASPFAD